MGISNGEMKILITGDASSAMGVLSQFSNAVKGTAEKVEGHFGAATSSIQGLMAPLAKLAAVLGGGALFKEAVSGTVEFAKEVGGLQRLMGGTSREATILSIAIGDIFGDTDTYESAASKLVKTLNKSESLIKGMGIQTRDTHGNFRAMNELLPEVVTGLNQYAAGTDRDAAAQAIFGRGFKDVLKYAAMTPEVMDAARKKSEDLGLVMDSQAKGTVKHYRDMLKDVGDALLGVKIRVGLEVMPTLTEFGNWFSSVAPAGINLVGGLLRSVIELLGMTSVKVGILAAFLPAVKSVALSIPLVTLAMQTFQVQMALAAREGVVGFAAISGAARGTASILTGMISPWTIITGVIVGAGFALEYFSKAHGRAMKKASEDSTKATQATESWVSASRRVVSLEETLKNAKGTENQARAQERLNLATKDLLEKYPDLAKFLIDENGKRRTLAQAIEVENKARLANLRIQLATAEATEQSLQAGIDVRKQWNASSAGKTEELNTGEGANAIIKVQANQKEIDFNNKEIAGTQKALELQKVKTASLRDQLTILTAIDEKGDGKHWQGNTGEGTALQKLKADLEQEKYLYEKNAADRGQLLEYSKAQEAAWLKENASKYALSAKERSQVDKMTFEAERAVMREAQDLKMADMKASMEAFKHDKEQQLAIAVKMEKEAANPKEAAAARAEQARIRQEVLDQEQKVLDAQLEMKRNHEVAMLDLDAQSIQAEREAGLISGLEALEALEQLNQRKYEIERAALEKRLDLANLEPAERAKIQGQIQALDDNRTQGAAQFGRQKRTEQQKENGPAGAIKGIREYLESSKNAFENWRQSATQVLNGVENAFAQGFQGILTGQMTFAEGLKSIWSGIANTIIGALAQMAAKWLVAAVASAIFGESIAKTAAAEAVAQQASAAAGIFAAHSYIPFVGPVIAAGLVAFMGMTLAANIASAKAMTVFASGGIVDGPTVGLLGEAGQRELVVPEITFTDWAENLVANLLGHEQKVQGYQAQAASYGSAASKQVQAGGGGVSTLNADFRGATIYDASQRGMRKLGAMAMDGLRAKAREIGVVLTPGRAFGVV